MTKPTQEPTQAQGNTPQLFVEKLAAGELSKEEQNAINERLEAEDGSHRVDGIHQSNTAILDEYPTAQLAASIRMRHETSTKQTSMKKFWLLVPISAVSAAAAAVFFMLQLGPTTETPFTAQVPNQSSQNSAQQLYEGIKGGALLHIHKQTQNGSTPVKSGDTVSAGDILQINFNAGPARNVVIYSVDGSGAATLHYPTETGGSTSVKPNSKQALPFGYELDDAPSFERFFMVWSVHPKAINTQEVLHAIKAMQNSQTDALQLGSQLKYKAVTVKK